MDVDVTIRHNDNDMYLVVLASSSLTLELPTDCIGAGGALRQRQKTKTKTFGNSKKKKTRNTGNRKNKFVEADCRRSIWSSGDDRNHRAHRKVPAAAPQDCCVWCFLSLTMLSKVVFSCNLHCNKKYDITSSYLTSFYTFISTLLLIGCNLMQFADCVTLSSLLLKGNQVLATCRSRWDLNLLELILNWSWGKGSINAQSSPVCSFVLVCFSLAPDLKHDHRSAHLQEVFFRRLSIAESEVRIQIQSLPGGVRRFRRVNSCQVRDSRAGLGPVAWLPLVPLATQGDTPLHKHELWATGNGNKAVVLYKIYVTVSHRIDSISHWES